MRVIGAQFNKISGPDATASYKIEFVVDESQRSGVLNLANQMKKGTELLLMIFETSAESEELKDMANETPEESRSRLNKRMYAMMNDIAAEKKIDLIEVKKTLKSFLIKKKYIIKSTSELDIKGIAAAIFYLQTEFNGEYKD